MSTDELIGQIYTWLETADENFNIEVLLDLPDVNWVTVRGMADRGADLINLSYRSGGISGLLAKRADEMVCERTAVKAIRRTERTRLDEFLGSENE